MCIYFLITLNRFDLYFMTHFEEKVKSEKKTKNFNTYIEKKFIVETNQDLPNFVT